MEEKKQTRIFWIDAAKIIAMTFIIISHTIAYSQEMKGIYKYVCSFHVALFFVISGLTFSIKKYNKFKDFAKNKFIRIMIPYFAFAILFLIPYAVLGGNAAENLGRNDIGVDIRRSAIGIIYGNGHKNYLRQNSSLWFLPCLFVTECIFYFVEKSKNKHKYIISAVVFGIIGALDYYFMPIRLPWGFDVALNMIPFLALGKIIKEEKYIREPRSKSIYILLSIMLIFIGAVMQHFNSNVMYMHNKYGNYILFIISAMCSIIGYIMIIKKLPYSKAIEFAGQRTMAILIFHKLIVLIFQTKIKFIAQWLKSGLLWQEILTTILVVAIAIIGSLLIGEIVNKICPWILGNKRRKEIKQ